MYPKELRYGKTHEWLRQEGEEATVGITDYAQDQINDVVFVELPQLETGLEVGKEFAVIESVKAAFDIYAPVSGKVIGINEELANNPGLVNSDPYGAGWLVKIKLNKLEELDKLLSADEYERFLEKEK
ncbi:glycine cleavage system protein GcvH [Candidatus Aerophobetes bacterium]|uniref:Glycine cleavage system H protein n=1 Tax=Aerophobetes bacterium TaxID=2030807 RepID=A0A523VZM4_UNCAE|nr:MAG: glycine cleavage system protein GcvH [Candidatus Aerophobetes bacterium]